MGTNPTRRPEKRARISDRAVGTLAQQREVLVAQTARANVAQCVTTHTEQNDHMSSREHAWLKIAHLCVIHVSCPVPCRT